MISYEHWRQYGFFVAVNLVVVSIIVQLMIRGALGLSGLLVLGLVVADLFVSRILRNRSETSGQNYSTKARGGFFRVYGYALVAGGLVWLVLRIKHGIAWVDFAPFVIIILLAGGMFSIGRKMRAPTDPDRGQERQQGDSYRRRCRGGH